MNGRILLLMAGVALLAACNDAPLDEAYAVAPPTGEGAFQWTRAEDVETHRAFLRNFGVGYSYDAIHGAYCNWEDIRCQVVNREELERQARNGNVMFATNNREAFVSKQEVRYSQRDYVATLDLRTTQKIDLGLYNKEKRTRQYVLEDGLQDCFYYMTEDYIEKGEQYIMLNQIMYQVEEDDNEELLTRSFMDAVEHLAYADLTNYAVVDSFVNVWGTHVVTRAHVGGKLQLTLKNDMWRYSDKVDNQAFTTEQVILAYSNRKENRTHDELFTMTEQSSLNINCRGGDQSLMGSMIGESHYDGSRNFDMSDVTRWRASVSFDPDHEEASNCEMVYMEVVPIWDFVPAYYPHVKRILKAIIQQDAAELQAMLGDRNFFSTKFPIRYGSASCQWRKATDAWQTATRRDSGGEPMVVNIVSGGRYEATVCHEQVGGQWLWVCYPIYEGKVKLACGVGVADDGAVYDVRWVKGEVKVRLRSGEKAGDTFYINGGAVGVEEQEGVDYAVATALPYVELSGGVRADGGYAAAAAYNVRKSDASFLLTAPRGVTDIVGFTQTKTADGGNYVYQRDSTYTYIYNQNEIK